jgi:hypothetical protein
VSIIWVLIKEIQYRGVLDLFHGSDVSTLNVNIKRPSSFKCCAMDKICGMGLGIVCRLIKASELEVSGVQFSDLGKLKNVSQWKSW